DPGQRGVALELGPCDARDLRGVGPVLAQEPVRLGRHAVAPPPRVDDQHSAPRPEQLQRSRHAGVAPANDDDVVGHATALLLWALWRRANSFANCARDTEANRSISSASASSKASFRAAL